MTVERYPIVQFDNEIFLLLDEHTDIATVKRFFQWFGLTKLTESYVLECHKSIRTHGVYLGGIKFTESEAIDYMRRVYNG